MSFVTMLHIAWFVERVSTHENDLTEVSAHFNQHHKNNNNVADSFRNTTSCLPLQRVFRLTGTFQLDPIQKSLRTLFGRWLSFLPATSLPSHARVGNPLDDRQTAAA